MKNNCLKTPLIQSAAVIFFGLICFGFVVSSEAHGLLGGLWAITTGIFSLILYAIALSAGIIVCISCLVGIFLGAVYLYSKEQTAVFYSHFKIGLAKLVQETKEYAVSHGCTYNFHLPRQKNKTAVITTQQEAQQHTLEQKIARLEAQIEELKEKEQHNSTLIKELSEKN